jgi:cyclophilin family peptidyl-prolyl cis-trans isomerase
MNRNLLSLLTLGSLALASAALAGPEAGKKAAAGNPVVVIETSLGTVKAELYPDKAPITVKNFLEYVDAKHYDGTIFHRVIDGFMVQGGGFDKAMAEKPTRAPIRNEAANGLRNVVGTLAMARTAVPDSATAQFYINVKDNAFLDHKDPSPRGIGYAVFGKVTAGMEVVDRIKKVRTGNRNGMGDVPVEPVIIKSIRRG